MEEWEMLSQEWLQTSENCDNSVVNTSDNYDNSVVKTSDKYDNSVVNTSDNYDKCFKYALAFTLNVHRYLWCVQL